MSQAPERVPNSENIKCNDNVITICYDGLREDSNMSALADLKNKREALNLRIKPEVRDLIDYAAELAGKTRTDFVLDAAKQAAEEAILDRTRIVLSPRDFAAFLERLDAPPRPNKRLQRTMRAKTPW